jgi:sugar phosphate isomerase/epimerase
MTNPILVQEQVLPGADLFEKWDVAQAWGFDGIELRGRGEGAFAARMPQLRGAAAAGVVMPTVCVEMSHFFGAFDPDLRRDAIRQLSDQLHGIGELGGRGVMTPASWGMFSRRLPPFEPPRSPEEDRAVLLDGLAQLGEVAASAGVLILLEPLNRYEDHMVNRLEDAASLIRELGMPSVRIGADTYHMNIEEADPARALLDAAEFLGHVQASDSNRLEPGAGHVDWPLIGATLRAIGYDGPVAIESRLSGPAEEALPRVPPLLRRYL